jgi:hypothetical protein
MAYRFSCLIRTMSDSRERAIIIRSSSSQYNKNGVA